MTEITGSKPKPWLEAWKLKHGKRAVQKTQVANNIGNEFHRCVEQIVLGRMVGSSSKRVLKMLASFIKWEDLPKITVIATEGKVWSDQYKYQGTLDCIALYKKKPILIDWKTSSKIYPDMDLQLVAYAKAYEEMVGIPIKKGWIVLVSKDKPHHKLTVREFTLGKRAFNKFLKLRLAMSEPVCDGKDIEDLP